mgnify:CR=1 FL=1
MDDFNFLHSSLKWEDAYSPFNLKNSFSKNYFNQVTLISVGKDYGPLLNSSLEKDSSLGFDFTFIKSLELFCRLRAVNNYSIFILDVENREVNKEIKYKKKEKVIVDSLKSEDGIDLLWVSKGDKKDRLKSGDVVLI